MTTEGIKRHSNTHVMKMYLFIVVYAWIGSIYAQNPPQFTDLYGDYMGQTPPDTTPKVFAPGIVSTAYMEHSAMAFSPDGNEVFWWVNRGFIAPSENAGPWISGRMMKRIDNRWTTPMNSPYGGGPTFSPDGRRLYFSNPITKNIADGPFYVEKHDHRWGDPQNIGIISRFPQLKKVGSISATHDGTLYFSADTVGLGKIKDLVIYRTKQINGEYPELEMLPPGINQPNTWNYTPFIAPNETYLIFASNRPGSLDNYGDLYISFHNRNEDRWSEPINLGKPINTRGQESSPGLSPDGKYLFYTGPVPGRQADMFWVSTKIIDKLKVQCE